MCFANLRISAVYIWTALWHVHVCGMFVHVYGLGSLACTRVCDMFVHVYGLGSLACTCVVCDMFVHVYGLGSLACTCVWHVCACVWTRLSGIYMCGV